MNYEFYNRRDGWGRLHSGSPILCFSLSGPGLCSGTEMALLVCPACEKLFRDPAVFSDRTGRFKNGQYDPEGISMDSSDPLDLLGTGQSVAVHPLADAVPVFTHAVDVLLCDNAGNETQPLDQQWALAHQPRLTASEGRATTRTSPKRTAGPEARKSDTHATRPVH